MTDTRHGPFEGSGVDQSGVGQLDATTEQARQAAGALLWSRDRLDLDELYRAGGALTQLTAALAEIADHLACGVERLRAARLRDDAGADPYQRARTAAAALARLAGQFADATGHAGAYHEAVGHLAYRDPTHVDTTHVNDFTSGDDR